MFYHEPSEATFRTLREASIALNASIAPASAVSFGLHKVQTDPAPEIAATQVAEPGAISFADGQAKRGWVVRDMTAEELANDEAQRRASMTVERWAFASAAMVAGIITPEEAQAWGPGNALPATVEAAITAAVPDPVQLSMAKVRALAAPRVSRANPLIEALRGAFQMTEEQADTLFEAAIAIEADT